MFDIPSICSLCKGQCCKRLPGTCYPEDFNNDKEQIKKALNSGRYAIDWWEGDPREGKNEYDIGYFIRPATKGREGKLKDASWGGECTFLTDKGCSLKSESRPMECRYLKPDKNFKCDTENNINKQDAAIKWLDFYEFLDKYEV